MSAKMVVCKKCHTGYLYWHRSKAGRWYLGDRNGVPHYKACDRIRAAEERNAKIEQWNADLRAEIERLVLAGDDAAALELIESAKCPY